MEVEYAQPDMSAEFIRGIYPGTGSPCIEVWVDDPNFGRPLRLGRFLTWEEAEFRASDRPRVYLSPRGLHFPGL